MTERWMKAKEIIKLKRMAKRETIAIWKLIQSAISAEKEARKVKTTKKNIYDLVNN